MLHLEVGEARLEAFAVGAGCHRAYHKRMVVLHPESAHHGVCLVVETVEEFDGIQASDGFQPQMRNGIFEGDDAPIRSVVGDDGRDIEESIYIFNAKLHIVFMIQPNHHTRLVKPLAIISADFQLGLELSAIDTIEERAVIHGEAVVGDTPKVGLGRHIHFEHPILDAVRFGLVEPLHLVEMLRLGS